MKYLIYFTMLLALVSRADDLLPEGTQVNSASPVESEGVGLSEPVPPASAPPALALPVESPVATATAIATATEVAPALGENAAAAPATDSLETVKEPAPAFPVDMTAQQPLPPPVAVPQIHYGPSAEEGYGSVGLKNEGQFLEVGGDRKTEESPVEGDRKTSSLPETVSSQ